MREPTRHLLVDFNSLAYYAAQSYETEDVVERFEQLLLSATRRWPEATLRFAMDQREGNQVRKQLWPAYKNNRRPTPEHMLRFFKALEAALSQRQYLAAWTLEYEADDILASWSAQCHSAEQSAVIISADRDLFQACNRHCSWIRPRDLNGGETFAYEDIRRKFGIEPWQLADVKALCGDKKDNIPGVPGIGMHSAIKIIRRFGPIEQLLSKPERLLDMPWKSRQLWAQSITKHEAQIHMAKALTMLYTFPTQQPLCAC